MMVKTMIIGMMTRAEYEIISFADAWHVLFLEDGHNGDADDNRGDDKRLNRK